MRLYEEILAIAREYMGAAAEDYIRRRIRIVIGGGDPEEITEERMERLAVGVDMTARGYMSDSKAEIFCQKIRELGQRRRRGPSVNGRER